MNVFSGTSAQDIWIAQANAKDPKDWSQRSGSPHRENTVSNLRKQSSKHRYNSDSRLCDRDHSRGIKSVSRKRSSSERVLGNQNDHARINRRIRNREGVFRERQTGSVGGQILSSDKTFSSKSTQKRGSKSERKKGPTSVPTSDIGPILIPAAGVPPIDDHDGCAPSRGQASESNAESMVTRPGPEIVSNVQANPNMQGRTESSRLCNHEEATTTRQLHETQKAESGRTVASNPQTPSTMEVTSATEGTAPEASALDVEANVNEIVRKQVQEEIANMMKEKGVERDTNPSMAGASAEDLSEENSGHSWSTCRGRTSPLLALLLVAIGCVVGAFVMQLIR